MQIVDDQQRGVTGAGLLHDKDGQHVEQLVGRIQCDVIAELLENAGQQLRRIQALAVDEGDGHVVLGFLEQAPGQRRLAAGGRAMYVSNATVVSEHLAQQAKSVLMRTRIQQLRVADGPIERLLPQPEIFCRHCLVLR